MKLKFADFFAVLLAVFAVLVAGFGVFDTVQVFGLFIALAFAVAMLLLDSGAHRPEESLDSPRANPRRSLQVLNMALLAVFVFALWRWQTVMLEQENFFIDISALDFAGGWVAFALIGYVTFRLFGVPMLAVVAAALAYALLPGSMGGADLDWSSLSDRLWFTFDGVFGRPFQVVATTVLIFIVYGAVLKVSGAGQVLLKMAFAATGRYRGGPAHAAIFGSSLFGTMSGAAVANVVSTGVFTIPIIKRAGFSPRFAAGIESAASTGGQIMPPVMGAVAFVMSDITGIPYMQIVLAALLPALMFYASLFIVVAVEARKQGVGAVPPEDRPRLTRTDWLHSLSFWIPLIVIIATLLTGRTPQNAGFYAMIVATVLCLILFPKFRSLRAIWEALVSAGRVAADVLVIVSSVGIVIGVVNMSGVGLEFANMIRAASGGNLFVVLLMIMVGCLIVGMGVPTLSAYLVLALVIGPLLETLEIPRIAAHMFILYFGVLSVITPPVALAAFAAAPIAGTKPMATGFEAMRLAIVGFIIPFLFVYHPDILLIDGFTAAGLAWSFGVFALSTWLIATGLAGFETAPLGLPERALRLVLALGCLWSTPVISLGAAALGLGLLGLKHLTLRTSSPLPASPEKGPNQ